MCSGVWPTQFEDSEISHPRQYTFFAIRHYLFELCTHMSHSLAEAHVCQLPTKDDRNEADFCISMPFKLNFIFISHSCGCDIHSTYEMENVRCFFASFDKWQFAKQHRIRYVTVRIAEYLRNIQCIDMQFPFM